MGLMEVLRTLLQHKCRTANEVRPELTRGNHPKPSANAGWGFYLCRHHNPPPVLDFAQSGHRLLACCLLGMSPYWRLFNRSFSTETGKRPLSVRAEPCSTLKKSPSAPSPGFRLPTCYSVPDCCKARAKTIHLSDIVQLLTCRCDGTLADGHTCRPHVHCWVRLMAS